MDFFDKLGSIAKSATEKASEAIKEASETTGDMVEIGKLKLKINTVQKTVEENKAKLGDCIYQKFAAGAQFDEDAAAICAAIQEAQTQIAAMQADIEKLKTDEAAAPAPVREAKLFCPACGAQLTPGVKFCGTCGAKLD